jgi:hypothetical protein
VMFQARPNHHHNLIYFSYRSCQNFLLGFNIKALLNLLLFYNYFNMKQIILGTHIFCFVWIKVVGFENNFLKLSLF